MPKLKTHRGAAKRLSLTKTGKVKRAHAFRNHIMASKSPKQKRNLRQAGFVDSTEVKKMKKLKTFILDMNVLDGDLTPCLDISYVTCGKDRRHYNLKDSDLPKGKIYRPEKELELWR